MNDIVITWKKITRGLPKASRFADDRVPTLEEIHRIIEYPDRRIKSLLFIQCYREVCVLKHGINCVGTISSQ